MSTVLVTGATGLTGSNVCRQLTERGDGVRALVRSASEAAPLAGLGVELVEGDITDAGSVRRAAAGCDGAIHSAALLGGASQDLVAFEAVNVDGTRHVLEAAAEVGMRRVVALSTGTFFDTSGGVDLEDAPLSDAPSDDPYTQTKREAFLLADAAAAAGQDVVHGHPGAIYGPAPLVDRALAGTSFNRLLRAAVRGRVQSYLRFRVSWVLADDVAAGSIAALDRGVSGERYKFDGRPEDALSTAACCNRLCEIAGVPYRVEDLEPGPDPELAKRFGPTLVAIASAERGDPALRPSETNTHRRLGYDPTSLDDGLARFVDWLKANGKLD